MFIFFLSKATAEGKLRKRKKEINNTIIIIIQTKLTNNMN
jgi:hypothetical protein